MTKPTLAIIVLTILSSVLISGCNTSSDNTRYGAIRSITDPHEFSITEWEFGALRHQLWESLKPASQLDANDVEIVRAYFDLVEQGKQPQSDHEEEVEKILALQIRSVLLEEGITQPADAFVPMKMVFPPVNFKFQAPPNLLVVSPRGEIRLLRRTTLEPNLTTEEKESIESEVDSLDYSSFVVGLGGVGFTYPTMVYRTSDIRRALDIVTEEWFHQYMAFKPLGFLYVLDSAGWRPDYEIITMNETAAGIVSKEIAGQVYSKHYGGQAETEPAEKPPSEFRTLMRGIRLTVDVYLAEGKVEQAEEYMARMRDILASKGYHIRKLNQAYFAFHGTYADDPATASPIGQDLQKLRAQSGSLKEFLDRVSAMTGYDDLKALLDEG